jgi:subtilisin family serine protease
LVASGLVALLSATAAASPALQPLQFGDAALGAERVIIELNTQPMPNPKAVQAFDAYKRALALDQDRLQELLDLPEHAPSLKRYDHLPYLAARLDADQIKAARRDPRVRAVHPDPIYAPALAQSTPLIGATTAWNAGHTGQNWVVAVLDTGSQPNHPFLVGKIVDGACFSTTDAGNGSTSFCPGGASSAQGIAAADDCSLSVRGCGHGTHVAGTAAGGGGQAFFGVARDAGLLPIQVFSRFATAACGQGATQDCALSYGSDQLRGLNHVLAEHNAGRKIASVNMSLGGGQFFAHCDNNPLKTAIDQLRAVGIATVIAAGNSGYTDSTGAPACISSAVSVGSTTKGDAISSFSNIAPFVNLLAPGSQINASYPPSTFAALSGTSMAAPHVAGAFAVLRGARESASVDEILNALTATGVSVTDNARPGARATVLPRIQLDTAITQLLGAQPGIHLAVSPATGLDGRGPVGGPFTPSSQQYTLQHQGGGGALSWSASVDVSWASVSPSSGTLNTGQSTTVTVSLAAAANQLPAGVHSGTLTFNNSSGTGGGTRTLRLEVSPPAAGNDKFADAVELLGSAGQASGNNVGAGLEPREPAHSGSATTAGGASLWWRWQAPSSGEVVFDTQGSSFDTLLAGYTGSAVDALTQLAANDDDGSGGRQSRIAFQVSAGTVYHVAVDGYQGATGDVILNWNLSADQLPPGELSVTPSTGAVASGAQGGPFSLDIDRYTLTNIGGSAIAFTVSEQMSWLSASPPSGTLNPGASVQVLLNIDASANSLVAGSYSGEIRFNSIVRPLRLDVSAPAGSGANDMFTNAALISGPDANLTASNLNASKESGEPDHAGNRGGRSLWWRWEIGRTGIAIVDTFGSNFDTLLAIYQDDGAGGLAPVVSNDDAGGGSQSKVFVQINSPAAVGFIAVDGYNGAAGSVRLNLVVIDNVPPANDAFASPSVLIGESGQDSGYNLYASRETDEPAHAGASTDRSLWWQWTAPLSGPVILHTEGSSLDTVLAVYTGSALAALTEIAANDDASTPAGTRSSRVSFAAQAGTVYRIAVAGYSGDAGQVQLALTMNVGSEIFEDGFETPTSPDPQLPGKIATTDGRPRP